MPYEVKIKDIETKETYKTIIKELKELRDILKPYETKTIEVDLHKVKRKVDL